MGYDYDCGPCDGGYYYNVCDGCNNHGSSGSRARDSCSSNRSDVNYKKREVYYEKEESYNSRRDANCRSSDRDCYNNYDNGRYGRRSGSGWNGGRRFCGYPRGGWKY